MKRVNLRVIHNGSILVQDRGDANGHLVFDEYTVDGVPTEQYGPLGTPRVLPFYSLTDREEKELLLGRAMTEQYVAANALEKQVALVNDLKAKEKAVSEQIEVTVVSCVSLPQGGVGVGLRLTERVEAEKVLKSLTEACQKADLKLSRAMKAARDATDAEEAKPAYEARGTIHQGFGRH